VITGFYHQYDKILIIVKNGSTITAWLIRSALVSAGVLLAWRIVVLGMAQFYTDQITPSSQAWYPKHPEALRRVARDLASRDLAGAEVSLREALHADPGNGETLMGLAGVWRAQDRLEDADRAVDLAAQLFPAWAKVHLQVADHWRMRGYPERTLEHWDLALRIQADLANRLFPVLLRLTNDPQGRAALASSARYSAPWWEQFLVFASQHAARVDTLRALYVSRRASGKLLSDTERNAYVARLQSEELWLEAYMIWFNTLTPEQLNRLLKNPVL
jgi:tetratricopeptide (TPR) repeat protein